MNAAVTPVQAARETILSHSEPPKPDSSLYFHRSDHTRSDGVQQTVLAGVHIVFAPGHANQLHQAFNVPRDQKLDPASLPARRALLIACDTLEITGPLSLPEYDVEIFARRLVFRDHGNINTTPLNWTADKAANADPIKKDAGKTGAEGRNAGSISVFIAAIETPVHESMARFVARGGGGQGAGLGRNGDKGKDMEAISNVFQHSDSKHLNTFTATFENPCVFAVHHWHWMIELFRGNRGVNDWPTSGQDALAPGAPGSGGNGGAWTSNQKDLAALADNIAGEPGATAPSVTGGAAGTPVTSTHYDLTIRFDLINDTANGDSTLLETRTTTNGKGYDAKGPTKGTGTSPGKRTVAVANAWVHPLQLECVLRYARDAFLANAREPVKDLLAPYEGALAAPMPSAKGFPWVADQAARWTSGQAEVASMLHRLRSQLDYFGNPAGYMPLLSLQASMRLYDLETQDALRTLMLAYWVQDKANHEQSAANALGSAIETANKDSAGVAEQLVQAESRMAALDQEMTALESRLNGLARDLENLRTELFNEASGDLHKKAFIKFGIKMAAAICQVVPVGQPVLGTLGKIANIAADISEKGTPDTVSKIGRTIKVARTAANKAAAAREKAKKKKKKAANAADAKKDASAWATVGDGLGPALSIAGEAIGAMQVSEDEIEVELAKLAAASPKWKALTDSIRVLNTDKSRLFKDLSAVLLAIGDGYARLSANAAAVATMHDESSVTLGKLSVEANQVVARMGQTARLSLQRTLYLLVKSYETTVLKPIAVDWSLDKVLDKIADLMKPQRGFSAEQLNAFLPLVAPLFEDNTRLIKKRLLDDYGFQATATAPLEFGFTAEQTADRLEALKAGRSLTLDPLALGLILPGRERAKAVGFTCKALTFSKDQPLPTSGNAIVSLRTESDGTGRRDEHLYAVRGDAPRVWTWTYHFSDRRLDPSVPSLAALDLLNLLLASDSDTIKQKLAAPPAWSGLTLDLEFSPPLPPERRPALTSLLFECTVESHPSPPAQHVLDVRGAAPTAPITIAPADLAGRGAGVGSAYRIYSTATRVSLAAPPQLGDRPFSHWEVLDGATMKSVDKPSIDVVLDSNTWAFCRYKPDAVAGRKIVDHFAGHGQEAIAREVGDPAQAAALNALIAMAPARMAARAAALPRTIRAAASADAPVIGLIVEGDRAAVLDDGSDRGWQKVAYDGMVGYIERR